MGLRWRGLGKEVAYKVTDEDCDPGRKRQVSGGGGGGGLLTNPGCPLVVRMEAGVGGRDMMSKVRLRSGQI